MSTSEQLNQYINHIFECITFWSVYIAMYNLMEKPFAQIIQFITSFIIILL